MAAAPMAVGGAVKIRIPARVRQYIGHPAMTGAVGKAGDATGTAIQGPRKMLK